MKERRGKEGERRVEGEEEKSKIGHWGEPEQAPH